MFVWVLSKVFVIRVVLIIWCVHAIRIRVMRHRRYWENSFSILISHIGHSRSWHPKLIINWRQFSIIANSIELRRLFEENEKTGNKSHSKHC